jgi:hypothetical protein
MVWPQLGLGGQCQNQQQPIHAIELLQGQLLASSRCTTCNRLAGGAAHRGHTHRLQPGLHPGWAHVARPFTDAGRVTHCHIIQTTRTTQTMRHRQPTECSLVVQLPAAHTQLAPGQLPGPAHPTLHTQPHLKASRRSRSRPCFTNTPGGASNTHRRRSRCLPQHPRQANSLQLSCTHAWLLDLCRCYLKLMRGCRLKLTGGPPTAAVAAAAAAAAAATSAGHTAPQ